MLVRQVVGDSMAPSLKAGRLVVARKAKFGVDDVVIVRHGGLEKIKRVVKIEGDKVWVLGDNAAHSTDSRSFGWLPADSVVAKVVWPRLQ